MKLIAFLFSAGMSALSAMSSSQDQNIDLSFKDSTSLTEILGSIEKNTSFLFVYNDNIGNAAAKKDMQINENRIEAVLDKLFMGTDIAYLIDDRQIFLYQKDDIETLKVLKKDDELIKPQKNIISGTIKDASTGEPVPGVAIVIKGTTTGTYSDNNGNFSLSTSEVSPILVISFLGYKTQEIPVSPGKELTVMMVVDVVQISDIVVVGYGVQKKESVVGAISTTTGETIKKKTQGGDLGVALTGALPGLSVLQTSGRPGGLDYSTSGHDDFASLYLRGKKTWNNSTPLVLVDGVERPLQNVDPLEVEKISLLKDASATAVFGVKGANGVILITTMHGKEGKAKLTFDASYTGKTLSRFMRRENSYMANLMKNYAILNEVPIQESAWNFIVPNRYLELWKNHTYPEYLPDVDWVDEIVKKWGIDKKINLNLSGGTKNIKYFGSLSYMHEGDMFDIKDVGYGYSSNFQFDRMNFRSNLDFDVTRTTKFSVNLSGYYLQQKSPASRGVANMYAMYNQPPDLYPVKYSDGTWGLNFISINYTNPIYQYSTFGYELNKQTSLNTDFILSQKLDFITKNLSVNGKISYDNTFTSSGPTVIGFGDISKYIQQSIVDEMYPGISASEIERLEKQYTIWNVPTPTGATGFDYVLPPNSYYSESASNASTYRNLYYEFSLNYARDFGKHSFSGLALMSRQERATGSEFLNYREDWVGRVTYGYDNRYNVEFNAAYNGSEKFSNKYRFGFFPSFGAGWTVSNESFFENLKPVVNNLKLRFSHGIIGSDAGISRWLYVPGWIVKENTSSTTSTDVFRFGVPYLQNSYPFRYEGVIPNPDIQWEKARKSDLGIESGFLENQIKISFDYFTETRTNIYMAGSQISSPEYIGFTAVAANKGRVDAHGWEFELQLSKTLRNDLRIWFTHSWSYAVDKIIEGGDAAFLPFYQKIAGYPIGQPRVYLNQSAHPISTWNGVYNTVLPTENTNHLPGNFKLVDYNSDGIIDANDKAPYGYPSRPQYTYAPSFGFEYKNIGFNMMWYGVYNVEGDLGIYKRSFAEQSSIVFPYSKNTAWSPELGLTTNATYPGLRFVTSGTSGYIEMSRAYLRLQHIELNYTLDTRWIKKLGVSNLRFTISGDNVLLISKMLEDLDPQQTAKAGLRSSYPTTRRVNFGLNFNFHL